MTAFNKRLPRRLSGRLTGRMDIPTATLALALFASTMFLAVAGEEAKQNESTLRITGAWVREAPPVAKVNAGYFSICNGGETDTMLSQVSSPRFGRVEMHQTVEENGTSRMERLVSVSLPAGKCVTFEPGGRHLMMFDAVERVRAGENVLLRFTFTNQADLEITAPVRRGDGNSSEHKHH